MTAAAGAPLRPDIQVLRGVAVSLVILYHAGLGLAPAGFLGVDIFFVISGFLIGGHVLRGLDDGSFRFAAFYLRRLRRLVPAAYAVLLACIVAGALLLTPEAHGRFAAQALGTLSYTTNVVLWRQINYFNNGAASEPLLHMWSLAIEEQFYLLLPLALWCLTRGWRGWAVGAVTGISLAAYLALYPQSPGAAFYLLPTRAWELGLGVATAILAQRGTGSGLAGRLLLPALALTLLPALIPLPLPGHLLAIPACLGTALLLLAAAPVRAWLRPMVRIGDASYALYLVHWPLFAFAHVLWLGAALPVMAALALVGLTGVLGAALHRWVEQPGRWTVIAPRRVVSLYLLATLVLAGAVWAGSAVQRARGPGIDLAGVTGLALSACNAEAERFDPACATAPDPALLVWGDSFSQQLVPALQASGAPAFAQASKGQCAPLLGLAPVDRDATGAFARGCHAFNASVMAYLAQAPQVQVVVLSGYYQRYAQPGTQALRGDGRLAPARLEEVIAAQDRTVAAIRQLGKRVVVVSGPVQARFDMGQCLARAQLGLPMVPPSPDCRITPESRSRDSAWTEQLFSGFTGQAKVPVLRLDRLQCPDGQACEARRGGVPLYRDANHLSLAGARKLGADFDLTRRAMDLAR